MARRVDQRERRRAALVARGRDGAVARRHALVAVHDDVALARAADAHAVGAAGWAELTPNMQPATRTGLVKFLGEVGIATHEEAC